MSKPSSTTIVGCVIFGALIGGGVGLAIYFAAPALLLYYGVTVTVTALEAVVTGGVAALLVSTVSMIYSSKDSVKQEELKNEEPTQKAIIDESDESILSQHNPSEQYTMASYVSAVSAVYSYGSLEVEVGGSSVSSVSSVSAVYSCGSLEVEVGGSSFDANSYYRYRKGFINKMRHKNFIADCQVMITNNERMITNNERTITNNERKINKYKNFIADCQVMITNNESMITNNESMITNNERKINKFNIDVVSQEQKMPLLFNQDIRSKYYKMEIDDEIEINNKIGDKEFKKRFKELYPDKYQTLMRMYQYQSKKLGEIREKKQHIIYAQNEIREKNSILYTHKT